MTDTTGYIYFAIITEDESFGVEDFNKYLSLKPTKFEKMFERGRVPKSTNWTYSTGTLINPICCDEIERLIANLAPHKEELKELKLHLPHLTMVLQLVLWVGDETPGLHFSKSVLDFLHELDVAIDCDIYNNK